MTRAAAIFMLLALIASTATLLWVPGENSHEHKETMHLRTLPKVAGMGSELKKGIARLQPVIQARPPYVPLTDPQGWKLQHTLPLEYRSGEVLSAEEVVYENGVTELLYVMDVGLGQEKILLIEKFDAVGAYCHTVTYSAERFDVLVPQEYLGAIKPFLESFGLKVLENSYGAPVINVNLPGDARSFLPIKASVELLLQARGELLLRAPLGREAY